MVIKVWSYYHGDIQEVPETYARKFQGVLAIDMWWLVLDTCVSVRRVS